MAPKDGEQTATQQGGMRREEFPPAALPECRVLAGWDAAGMVRFEIDEAYAESLLQQVRKVRQTPRDGFVDIVFVLDRPAFASLTKGFAELLASHRDGDTAAKQVVVTPDSQGIAVSVICNASQLESSAKKNYAALKQHPNQPQFGHEFSVSADGAILLIQQLEAALNGHENPLDAVDTEDDRFEVTA